VNNMDEKTRQEIIEWLIPKTEKIIYNTTELYEIGIRERIVEGIELILRVLLEKENL